MHKLTILVVILLVLSSCGGGADAPDTEDQSTLVVETLAADLDGLSLTDFYAVSFTAIVYRSPEGIIWNAISNEYPLDTVGLDNLSDTYVRETFAIHQLILDTLRSYDRTVLNADDQLTFDLYEWYLQDNVDRLEFIYYDFIATYNFNGVQDSTQRFFTDIHPLLTEQDAEDYVTRLNAVPEKFRQVADFLSRQNGAGIIEPAITMDVALYYLGQIADGSVDSNPYFTSFRDKVNLIQGLSSATRQSLVDSARAATSSSVIVAYQELRGTINSLRGNAPSSIGVAPLL